MTRQRPGETVESIFADGRSIEDADEQLERLAGADPRIHAGSGTNVNAWRAPVRIVAAR
jgi:hypothetical protein